MLHRHQLEELSRYTGNYRKFQRTGTPASVCHGIAADETAFAFTLKPIWTNNCAGWVKVIPGATPRCPACALAYYKIKYTKLAPPTAPPPKRIHAKKVARTLEVAWYEA